MTAVSLTTAQLALLAHAEQDPVARAVLLAKVAQSIRCVS